MDFQAYQEAVSALHEIQEKLKHRIIDLQEQNDLLEQELELISSKYNSTNLDSYFSIIPANLIVIDGHGIIRLANESALHFFNLKTEEIIGVSLRSLLAKMSFHDFTKYFSTFKNEHEKPLASMHNLQLRDKRQFSFLLRKVRNTHEAYSSSYIGLLSSIDSSFSDFSDYLGNMAINQMHEGITITDVDGVILRVNSAFTAISGFSREEAIGKTPALLKSGRHSQAFYEKMWQSIAHHGWWEGEIWNRRKNGHVYPQWIQINRINDPISKKIYYMSTFSDITERKEHQERLDQLAHYDELTGLMNRRFLMVTLQLLLDRVQTTQGKVAVLFVDLDHFKQINDQFGHHEGDLLLQEASQRILASVRQSDIVGRVGGDEFVIVLSRIESYESAQGIALKIIHSLNQVFQLSTSHFIGASVGIAYYPVHGKSMNDLMRHADSAMYRAKNSGRSQFAIFNEDDEDALISHKEIKNLLRRAIENPKKYLQMYYQPLFDPFTSTLISAEALVRLFNEEGKMISPDVFIEIAENEGFMYELGEKIFESVCEFVKNAKNLGYTPPRIAINLSVAQLVNENLFSTFSSIAQSYALEVNTFSYEITETSAMQKLSSILSGIMEFKNAGCLIMLDDFGTGYASLSQIYKLPIDVIKIDKSFTDLIEGQDSSSKKLIHAIISMANALNIDVIVEGVETKEQLEWLMQHNVKKVQGYYFSKPLDGDTFTRNYLACKSEL